MKKLERQRNKRRKKHKMETNIHCLALGANFKMKPPRTFIFRQQAKQSKEKRKEKVQLFIKVCVRKKE